MELRIGHTVTPPVALSRKPAVFLGVTTERKDGVASLDDIQAKMPSTNSFEELDAMADRAANYGTGGVGKPAATIDDMLMSFSPLAASHSFHSSRSGALTGTSGGGLATVDPLLDNYTPDDEELSFAPLEKSLDPPCFVSSPTAADEDDDYPTPAATTASPMFKRDPITPGHTSNSNNDSSSSIVSALYAPRWQSLSALEENDDEEQRDENVE